MLQALLSLAERLPPLLQDEDYAYSVVKRILIATFDVVEDNKSVTSRGQVAAPLSRTL